MINYSMSVKPRGSALVPPPRPMVLGQGGVERFIDSPILAIMTDFTAASASAYLAYSFGQVGNRWSTFFWVVSAMSAVKLLHDLGRPA
jgi:hypothetical protein